MSKICSAFGCNLPLSYIYRIIFQYPSEHHTRWSWIVRVRGEGFNPTSTSYVCSRHCSEDQFSVARVMPLETCRERVKSGSISIPSHRASVIDERIQKRINTVSRGLRSAKPFFPFSWTAIKMNNQHEKILLSRQGRGTSNN